MTDAVRRQLEAAKRPVSAPSGKRTGAETGKDSSQGANVAQSEETPRFVQSVGQSGLAACRVFHLNPANEQKLTDFLTTQLGARRC